MPFPLQTKLITKADVAAYKQVSVTLSDDLFNQHIIQAQIQDVAPLLGEELFNAIMKTPADFIDLLDGGEYTVEGKVYVNYGLKSVIAHYAYAQYKMFGQSVDTPFGFVEKLEGAESKPEDINTKRSLYKLNQDSAFTMWRSVENFLIRTNVALYNSGSCTVSQGRPGGLRISKITKYS